MKRGYGFTATPCARTHRRLLPASFYLFVDDVDAEAERLKSLVKAIWGPEDMDYGLREFGFEGLNGYRLVLAQDI